MKGIVIIPARGGSKGIPKKNVRTLIDKPLIAYSIINALGTAYDLDVIVSTDDQEISHISSFYGVEVVKRPNDLGQDNVTLDPVIFQALEYYEKANNSKYDYVITMQPTSPLLSIRTLNNAIQYFLKNDFDTVISCYNDPHLSWTIVDGKITKQYDKRVNRQYLPKNYVETGAFLISKRSCINASSRIGEKTSVFEVPQNEAIDIDTVHDWWIAERELSKKNILIRVEGYSEIGLGHIYRGILLAQNLINHNIMFAISSKSDLGIKKLKDSFYPYTIIDNDSEFLGLIKDFDCNILINDILDTTIDYMQPLSEMDIRIINFEDLGPGANYAHAVINDLYETKISKDNYYWGSDYYLLRDEFIYEEKSIFNDDVKNILILFGGTDPSNLTSRLINIVKQFDKTINFTFILGMGYPYTNKIRKEAIGFNNIRVYQDVKSIAKLMRNSDLAISSQGRTMLELASMNVPTILLAQNERELHHEFGYLQNGFINLGLGYEANDETIKQTILWLINSSQIRRQMYDQMKKTDLKQGIKKVLKIILEGTYEYNY